MTRHSTPAHPILDGLTHIARGKVREIYDVDEEHILIVATDRISAFDCVLPTPIPGKGRVLTQLSAWWFEHLLPADEHHLVTADIDAMPRAVRLHARVVGGRATYARRAQVFPIECVVRGFLSGSGWKDYQRNGSVCGIELPSGLLESAELPEPIFTPSTKATSGHDENISFAQMEKILGADVAADLCERSLDLYTRAAEHARGRGILLADTKFEFGRLPDGSIVLVDEAFTPDSSRFWPLADYQPGRAQPSFDKQFVRDYLIESGWDREPPAPELPGDVVAGTRERYLQAYELLTGTPLPR